MAHGDIAATTEAAMALLREVAAAAVNEEHSVAHYGSNHIHPRHLSIWICVQSDRERDRLQADVALMQRLRQTLDAVDYPAEGRDEVFFGFESQETVDRESDGDWWQHWR